MVLSELGGRLDRRNDDRDEKQVSFDDNAGVLSPHSLTSTSAFSVFDAF